MSSKHKQFNHSMQTHKQEFVKLVLNLLRGRGRLMYTNSENRAQSEEVSVGWRVQSVQVGAFLGKSQNEGKSGCNRA